MDFALARSAADRERGGRPAVRRVRELRWITFQNSDRMPVSNSVLGRGEELEIPRPFPPKASIVLTEWRGTAMTKPRYVSHFGSPGGSMDASRRDFLKLATIGGTAAAVFGFDLEPAQAALRTLKIARANETRSTCPYCSVSCGVIIYTIGDRAKNRSEEHTS